MKKKKKSIYDRFSPFVTNFVYSLAFALYMEQATFSIMNIASLLFHLA